MTIKITKAPPTSKVPIRGESMVCKYLLILFVANVSAADLTLDSDFDGIVDIKDECVHTPGEDCQALTDLNADHVVNFKDLGLFKSVFFTDDEDADFNEDGVVNFQDLGIMGLHFFEQTQAISCRSLHQHTGYESHFWDVSCWGDIHNSVFAMQYWSECKYTTASVGEILHCWIEDGQSEYP